MRPDDTRFHLLLGSDDWGRCRMTAGAAETSLAALWAQDFGMRPVEPPNWDAERGVITLPQVRALDPLTPGEQPLGLASRRAASADTNGNIYWIGSDSRRLYVRSAGSGRSGPFWPDPRGDRPAHDIFGPAEPQLPGDRRYSALAVTEEGWLVAAFEEAGASGLSRFDLIGGGAPTDALWPAANPIRARDLSPGCCGGLWLLDDRQRLFELDRTLGIVGLDAGAPETDLFQPDGAEARSHAAPPPPSGRDLTALDPAIDAIAIEALPDGAVVLLSRGAADGQLFLLPAKGVAPPAPLPIDFVPHDMALGTAMLHDRAAALRIAVTGGSGNWAIGFRVEGEGAAQRLHSTPEVFPLRRYGGLALVAVRGALQYDSGDRPNWAMLVERPRLRFTTSVTFKTPPFDAGMPQVVWDRIRLDGCIPPGTALTLEALSADETGPAGLAGEWVVQPRPILNATGSEFAGYGPSAIPATDAANGRGSYELLLQRMRGRYLQLRITLSADGDASPHVRALRAWYPRQSWSERYLPAVYRSDPEPADFLERYLANMEGTVSVIERRIADAQVLFDPDTAPAETLDWLASWFDVALDPAWDERRRRLFIAYAVRFFALRGTVRGVQTALALAFDPCVDERLFTAGQAESSGLRIVESFLTRPISVLAPRPGGAQVWTPEEGNAGLADRIARAEGQASATATQRAQPVPLFPAEGEDPAAWGAAMATALGFVPEAGGEERQRWQQYQISLGVTAPMADLPRNAVPSDFRESWDGFTALASRPRRLWQDFLQGRYRTLKALNLAHGASWLTFAEVSLPDHLPVTMAGQNDWRALEGSVLATDAAAHRFTVLLPVSTVQTDAAALAERTALARRIVELEKPAHTIFDVRLFFAMNRIGEARLGLDTALGQGSRAPELLPPAILGSAYLGESFIGPDGPPDSDGRRRVAC
jgi:phage tail-like protein